MDYFSSQILKLIKMRGEVSKKNVETLKQEFSLEKQFRKTFYPRDIMNILFATVFKENAVLVNAFNNVILAYSDTVMHINLQRRNFISRRKNSREFETTIKLHWNVPRLWDLSLFETPAEYGIKNQ